MSRNLQAFADWVVRKHAAHGIPLDEESVIQFGERVGLYAIPETVMAYVRDLATRQHVAWID